MSLFLVFELRSERVSCSLGEIGAEALGGGGQFVGEKYPKRSPHELRDVHRQGKGVNYLRVLEVLTASLWLSLAFVVQVRILRLLKRNKPKVGDKSYIIN